MLRATTMLLFLYATGVVAQAGFSPPTIETCLGFENITSVACVNRYASVLPYPFARNNPDPEEDNFINTEVPSDSSFQLLQNASFIVFDQSRGLEIIGSAPKVERMFDTRNDSIHEAPVYVPDLNVLIFSLPHQGIYEQQLINLNTTPPTLENYTTHPPVYAVNGGKWYKNRIYWAAEASFTFPDPTTGAPVQQSPGIYMLDPYTNTTTTLVNNYFGTKLNSPNDLFIDAHGDIFFTDSWYGYAINVTTYPVHAPATYRFRPSTGALSVVENTLEQPNGIGISPDGTTMYISDTGVTDFTNVPPTQVPRYNFNPRGSRAVYAFDVLRSPAGACITGKRPIWLAQTFAVDGLHVSHEGYVLGAAGTGIDVLSAWGELLVRIEIGEVVNNFQFVGAERDEIWAVGPSGIWRITGLGNIHGLWEE
ncbi:lactonohydrolase [Bimuria novae-zelandiae CBS 107.79]|uniref:Lactonohydrolase n=1 Tax=Bimuria novae-zelandiae CBS 107.79 TaxID=1447943 RepID=A0A6A5VD72_9PLEO|nr:lactonohydrolase [Bimuria novae-zelandiae CBS 107.79]